MRLFVVILFVCAAHCQTDDKKAAVENIFGTGTEKNGAWVPDGYEVVTTKGLGSITALPKCGEGSETGKKVCVPYYRCDPATNTVTEDKINTDGSGLIDIRAGVSDCPSYLDVCCNLPEGGLTPTTQNPSVEVTPTLPPQPTPPPQPKLFYCGIRNEKGIDFQITGNTDNEAEYGEFPWMVAILKASQARVDEPTACGGSLITPQVVLTGAHCVYKHKVNELKVRAGEWDTQTTNERIPYQERSISSIIVHENFNSNNLFNDVALVILERPLAPADNVGTICLPPQSQKFTSNNCFATGWGKTAFNEVKYSAILKKIELPIVNVNNCQNALRKTRLGPHFKLDKSFVCAGGEPGKDTCTGDGGSPLVCPDPLKPGRYQQAGLVAWGIGCGDKLIPGVYADISQFRNWIDGHMQRLNIDTKPYNL